MKHQAFILSPLTKIVEETVTSCYGIGDGISTSSISEHVFQSLFLRMTGALEQKMKCICWDMATYDYEYRYKRFKKDTLGECSSYDEKKIVINDIISNIEKEGIIPIPFEEAERNNLLQELINDVTKLLCGTTLEKWKSHDYKNCEAILGKIKSDQFLTRDNVFLDSRLQKIYKKAIKHRNRCAHNTLSYQENLPTLKTLHDEDYIYENYFLRYAILILIDKITITLYSKYLQVMGMQT